MADARLTPETNGIRYGLFTAVGMVIYFVVASFLNLTDRIEFSFLNAVILAIGVCMAIANYKRYRQDRMPYLHGFGTGIITAMIASLTFAFFFILYAGVLNKHIMDGIRAKDLFGFDLSVTIAFLAILLQGSLAGVIISLVAMQYYKSPDHKPITGIE
jgi:drug/metabolite transporter (DMT)-like permease